MADYAHDQTDKELQKLERKLNKIYKEATKDVEKKCADYLRDIEQKNKGKLAELAAGKITQEDYNAWFAEKSMQGRRWELMRDTLAEDLTNTNKIAMSMVQGHLPDAYAMNHNYSTYLIEKGTNIDTSFTLYDRDTVERLVMRNPDLLPKPKVKVAKDIKWNKQKINSAVLQGVLQGESIPNIAKRLRDVTTMNKNISIRNARTAMTGAENAGRIASYKRAKDLGIELEQVWLATLDGRTRHTHRQLDGESIEVDGKFSNGCRYPGDPDGPPGEVYNCRCTLIGQLKGYGKVVNGLEGRNIKHLGNMTYEEWKNAKAKNVEQNVETGAWSDKVKNIQSRVLQNGVTEDDVMEAGKLVANEINNMYAESEKIRLDKVEEYNVKLRPLNKERHKIWKELNNTNTIEFKELHPSIDEQNKIRSELKKKFDELGDKISKLDDEQRKYIDLAPKYHKSAQNLKGLLSEVREMGADGLDIKKHLSKSKVYTYVDDAYNVYPKEWVQKSIDKGKIKLKKLQRGYYDDYNGVIAISVYNDDHAFGTAVHELGHRYERAVPGIKDMEKSFYERRTAGESLDWLGAGYGRSEKTRKDNFVHPYMGKDYGGSAYELVSMGFQLAYTDPMELAKDPDMEAWIYGLLSLL